METKYKKTIHTGLLRDFLVFCGLVLADQGTKIIFVKYISNIVVYNANIGFDIGFGGAGQKITSSLIFLIVLVIYLKYGRKINFFALVLMLGGAFSNLIDRFARAGVVDFINLKIWPSFNLADAFIVIGVLIIARDLLKEKVSSR